MKRRIYGKETARAGLILWVLILLVVVGIAAWQCGRRQRGRLEEDRAVGESGSWIQRPDSVHGENEKRIAITFDDGPAPGCTDRLLDGLKERGVKASFFLIGEKAERFSELVRREAEEGHLIGNHTYRHVQLTAVSMEEARREILDTQEVVSQITGKKPEYMRPPFGAWQKELEEELGLMPVLWTVDPLDWTTANEDEIVNKVVTEAEENDIILLHDCYESSVNAALRIIDLLSAEGYEFVTVDALILD